MTNRCRECGVFVPASERLCDSCRVRVQTDRRVVADRRREKERRGVERETERRRLEEEECESVLVMEKETR